MGKYMKMETVIAIILATCLMGGCANTYTKRDTGTALGALTGGALAYGLSKGSSNKGIWTVLGIGLGAMMGQHIGSQLDDRDRLEMAATFRHTMRTKSDVTQGVDYNQGGYWRNSDTGNFGTFTPTRTYRTIYGNYCREFTQIIYIGGNAQKGYGTACQQPDNSWKIVQ